MNILLVRPPDPLQHVSLLSHTRPMNLAYLAAYIRKAGFTVKIIDYEVKKFREDEFMDLLEQEKPDLLGVSCMTPTINNGAKICELVKKASPKTATLAGGPHANGLPLETMREFSAFDYLIFGEGEVTLLELCQALQNGKSVSKINGLIYRDGRECVQNEKRELIGDLDTIPFPARDLINYGGQSGHSSRGFSNEVRSTELFTSRGCPFGCTFCAIQATFGRKVRFRNLSCIEQEINDFIKDYQFNHVVVADDTFTLKQERAFELCEIFKRTGITSWNCDTRVNTVSQELLQAMGQSGCQKVAFGVESGSPRILKLNGKQIKVEEVRQAVCWAKEAGIKHIEGNFIIGSDISENLEDVNLTRSLIKELPWTFVSVTVIVPYPGTAIYKTMRESNCFARDICWEDFVMFGREPKWHTENFSAAGLLELQKKLSNEFYLNPGYIAKQLAGIRSWAEVKYWFNAGATYFKWYFTGKV